MSDRLTTNEIEDVLSSIRRLVSEDTRPPLRNPAGSAPSDGASGKLVLTPALRIVPAAGAAPVPAQPETPAPAAALAAEPQVPPAAPPDPPRDRAAATLEAAVAAQAPVQDWEPDGGEPLGDAADWVVEWDATARPTTPGGRAIDWDDDDGAADRDPAPAAPLRATPPDAEPADEFLDEEALRDLVRDIIREELQGTLGERITRNVRKLVRAEINRALATRDFD